MSGGRRCVEVPVIEIGKDAEDKTRRQAVDDLFLFKAGRWRAMRRWRDQRKADYFHLGRGIFRRINAASPSASAPLRPPPSLHLCGSQLEYAPQSENSTFEPSQSTFEQAPTEQSFRRCRKCSRCLGHSLRPPGRGRSVKWNRSGSRKPCVYFDCIG